MHPPVASASTSDSATYSKVTLRILPFLFLCYVVAYLDRVNVGFAKLQMQSDLQFSDTVFFAGAGIFFIGYFLFEIPSNLILEKVGARLWLTRIMITWGIISSLTMFVDSEWLFYLVRFLLGIAEAGFFPGIILYLTYWYPSKRRAQVIGLFMSAIAVTGIIGNPLSGWIMQVFHNSTGLRNWQMLFLIEGIPSIVVGFFLPFVLPNRVADAKWLEETEKARLTAALEHEETLKTSWPLSQIFVQPRLLLYCLVYFGCAGGLYGISFWLPQLIKDTGIKDPLTIGFLGIIPNLVAGIGMIVFGWSSDRFRERRWHFTIAAFVGCLGLLASSWFTHETAWAITCFSIGSLGVLVSLSLFWPIPTAYLGGTSAAAGIALINSIGNLGGFALPFAVGWLNDHTKQPTFGLWLLAAFMLLSGLLIFGSTPKSLPVDEV